MPAQTLSRRRTRPAVAPVRALVVAAVLLSVLAVGVGARGGLRPGATGDWLILFLHVPAAWLSLALFGLAVAASASTLSGRGALSPQALAAVAPVGVAAACVALWTGIASQQVLGAWWGWDARLVSELLLLLLFAAVLVLRSLVRDAGHAERASAVVVLVGALNIPIIYLSVDWWQTLHERAAATVAHSPCAIAATAAMTLAFCMVAGAVVLARLQAFARERDGGARTFATARAAGSEAPAPAKEQQ